MMVTTIRFTGKLAVALIIAAVCTGSASIACASPQDPGLRIAELRAAADYSGALDLARRLEQTLGALPATRAWERDDAARLVSTLKLATALSASDRSQLAGADRADEIIARLVIEGEYRRAVLLTEQQLATRERCLGRENQETLRSRKRLADLANLRFDFYTASIEEAQVLRMRRSVLGEKHPEIAESLQDLAYALKNRGGPGANAEALLGYEHALALREEILDPDDPAVLTSQYWMADMKRVAGENGPASEMIRDLLDRRARTLGADHPDVIATVSMLAYLLQLQGRMEEASPYAELAARMSRTAPGVRKADRSFALSIHAYDLVYRREFGEAERVLSETTHIQEFLRLQSVGMRLRTGHGLIYAARAAVQLELGKESDAWRSLERGASRRVLDSMVPPDTSTIRFAAPSIDVPDNRFLSLEEIQAVLPDDAALIGWIDHHRYTPLAQLGAWGYVIRSHGPVHWERIAPSARTVSAYMEAIRRAAAWPVRVTDLDEIRRGARDLYDERVAPLEPSLRGVNRLIVVLTSPVMSTLQIEAMEDDDGNSVVDRYEVSYVPSATTFAWMRRSGTDLAATDPAAADPATWRAMLIGDPILPRDRTEVSLASSAPPTPREDVPSGYFKAFDCLKPLPRARDEVVHAAACFDSPTILLDAAASAKNVRRAVASGELSRCHLVHFATHAFESMGHDLGALVFSPDSTAGTGWPDDALIRAWEIAGWQLNAELVTMSACKTAGGTAGADTPLGLSTIFLMAGARSVLTSMWRVDDTATALLMQRFYDSLTGGRGRPMSRAAALREAKQWFRDQEDADGNRPFAHPAYWAGFVLIGDGLD